MALRFAERVGTPGSDNLAGATNTITFGLAGNDTLTSSGGSVFSVLVGGSGNDTYTSRPGTVITVADNGGGFDRLVTSTLSLGSNTVTAIVDGRHFLALNQDTGEAVFVLDYQQSSNAIEAIQTPDGTFSSVELVAFAQAQPSFQGNLAWEDLLRYGLAQPVSTLDTNEAIAFYAYRATALENALPVGSEDAVYRFFDTRSGSHFYTASVAERDQVAASLPDFRYEGEAFEAAPDGAAGTIDVFRFLNTQTGTHFYTANVAERDLLIQTNGTSRYEGEAYEAYAEDGAGRAALHRFLNTDTGSHFYTASADEQAFVAANFAQYRYEGVGYYVDL
ncbi:hypothetical protein [Aureimonas phyllosphaerae]|uniref:DUF5648 domain-containing protein n=1 Tax=Aureimonas phyllosphaerae TaxID=1166078 RepID=A0A7W6FX27_9HYPH|nr:hypothetical protein [Aureimonas phyllosphaerae]MBB3937652.1 hypothetical protein [Aureimonas phyllosphaerae]MBB3961548.1 hypothetical protein [Aureimonas phyllosphaerae]SFF55464.1 hypothetical protein SAMN05216566_1279 [Aureimonas phyllosphaerae]